MDNDVWTTSPGRRGRTVLTLIAAPRPLLAALTEAELASAAEAMQKTEAAVRRGEFSRVQLGEAFRTAIGRDPFRQAQPPSGNKWWLNLAHIVVGLGFASSVGSPWLKAAGYALAVVAFAMLVSHLARRLRE